MHCVTTEWIRSLLMKHFYTIKHRENLCKNSGKTEGILSWLKYGHPVQRITIGNKSNSM